LTFAAGKFVHQARTQFAHLGFAQDGFGDLEIAFRFPTPTGVCGPGEATAEHEFEDRDGKAEYGFLRDDGDLSLDAATVE
jgi:hypothetical protein